MSNGFDLVCQTGFNSNVLPGLYISLVGVSCGSSGINGTGDINTLSLPNTSVGGAPRGPVGAGEGTTWRSLSEASLITVALSNGATERASILELSRCLGWKLTAAA